MLTVLVVDDHPIFRFGVVKNLQLLLPSTSICEAPDGTDALDIARRRSIDLVLLDMHMEKMNGYDTASILVKEFPKIKIAVISSHFDHSLVLNFMKLGIQGYLDKGDDNFYFAIKRLVEGHSYFSPLLADIIAEGNNQPSSVVRPTILTQKEKHLLALIANGKKSEQIAVEMKLSKLTVDSYRKELLTKFKMNNCTELIDFAHKVGLL